MKHRADCSRKLVIVCRTMPPQIVGSAVLMRNLFEPYRGELEAIAGWEQAAKSDPDFGPICPTHYLRFWPPLLQRLMERRLHRMYFPLVVRFIRRKLQCLRPAAVFSACTPDGFFFVASFRACRRLGVPFWGHMHDLWLENTGPGDFQRRLAETWEPVIFRDADKIFCMTEAQRDHYQRKYGGSYDIIPHCVSSETEIPSEAAVKTKPVDEPVHVLYAGNISPAMNCDAMKDFAACLDLLPANYRFTMLTSASAAACRAKGLVHPRLERDWTSVAEASKRVRQADILFLPLSFKNCHDDEVRTVFATKTLDYLVSGVPILTYSPADSHHSRRRAAERLGPRCRQPGCSAK